MGVNPENSQFLTNKQRSLLEWKLLVFDQIFSQCNLPCNLRYEKLPFLVIIEKKGFWASSRGVSEIGSMMAAQRYNCVKIGSHLTLHDLGCHTTTMFATPQGVNYCDRTSSWEMMPPHNTRFVELKFGNVWLHSDVFGYVWNRFRYVWKCLDKFEWVWISSDKFRLVWISSDKFR